jgi:hypothetical protein
MLCKSAQMVSTRPAMPCRIVTARRPETMVTVPLGGTRTSNSTAALRGTGTGGGSTGPASSHGTAIWSSCAVGMMVSREGPCGRNRAAGGSGGPRPATLGVPQRGHASDRLSIADIQLTWDRRAHTLDGDKTGGGHRHVRAARGKQGSPQSGTTTRSFMLC